MTTHERAVLVDTRLAEIWGQQAHIDMNLANTLSYVHTLIGERANYTVRRGDPRQWPTTNAEAEAKLRETPVQPWRQRDAERTIAKLDSLRAEYASLADEAKPLQAEYNADPWQRFFLVQNAGGHIHKTMQCSTTFPTTQWAWLPTLSGLTEDAAVEQEGPRLCSVCFPSAPVEWTLGLPAKVDPNRCPGSGQVGARIRNTRYGTCPVCGRSAALSNTGKLRTHNKPKEA